MKTRFTWILGVAALISAGLLVACSSKYTSTSNGLVVVSTQSNSVMDTFSLNLGNGHITQIYNVNGPPTNGVPTAVVLAPGGAFSFVLITQSTYVNNSATGIESFPVGSDGKLGTGTTQSLNPSTMATAVCSFTNQNGQTVTQDLPVTVSAPVVPVAMVMDSAGKFLFVADAKTSAQATYSCNGAQVTSAVDVSGAVSVFSVNGGGLTEVSGSPFSLPSPAQGGATPSASALAVSPTVYPPAYSVCSANTPPTSENLYVTDSLNNVVLNYSVASTGVLTLVPPASGVNGVATGTVPSGVTVDPCNRFVYVSDGEPDNSVSAYTICSNVNLPACPQADFSLQPASGSPFTAGTNPGALLVDPLGNYLYVVDQGQNAISAYAIKTVTGGLTQLTVAAVTTNANPTSIAIRSDDTWMFVTNLGTTNVSQYAITPSTGVLTPQPPFQTDGNPWGVAVK